jgi:4-nitrophenyl phosphatase
MMPTPNGQSAKPITNLILDMDGVLWRGETPMPGLVEFFAELRSAGIGFVLATNNATKTATMYAERLARFGVAVPPEQILTSAEATASYLAGRFEPGAAAYVVGAKGLHDAITARDFRIVSPAEVRAGESAAFVVVGFSPNATYEDLAMGSLLVHRGVPFVGTNPDPSFPSELGPLPGAGALLAVISTATGIQPTVIGKPGPIVFHEAVKRLGGDATTVAMVGDRLSTDIVGAKAAGLRAILVLSGISTRAEAETAAIRPDYIFDDITAVASFLTAPFLMGVQTLAQP